MTNGEKLKEVFPDMESIILHDLDESFVDTTLDGYSTFNLDWWEAEYKEPTTKDDAVSRQAVLNTLDNMDSALDEDKTVETYKGLLKECYKVLPPVTPQEPKTGHWITTRTFMHDGEFYCDRCKCEAPKNEKWDYCPNCGAKMVEPQESEETDI